MKKKTILLMLLAVVTTANAWAQRGKRAIERIDRDVQTRVFIPKVRDGGRNRLLLRARTG